MSSFYGNDDFDIDERTDDFNLFSEVYGYERKQEWDDDFDSDDNEFDDGFDDEF